MSDRAPSRTLIPAVVERVEILYQDEHMLVVDKPPHVLVVHAPGRRNPTVVDIVSRQIGASACPVHRLDEDTSGVLALARTAEARSRLEETFRRHRAERIYLALLSRVPSPTAGRIESRLAERGGRMCSVERGGEVAVTHYRLLRRVDRFSLAECRLETGRRNQIRVHMADIGCPVVGDRKYGYRSRHGGSYSRVMLHAWRLVLPHPVSEERLEVVAEPSEDELRP